MKSKIWLILTLAMIIFVLGIYTVYAEDTYVDSTSSGVLIRSHYTDGVLTREDKYYGVYDSSQLNTRTYYYTDGSTYSQISWYSESGVKTAENRYDALGNATVKYYFYTDGTDKQFEWYTNGVKTAENRYDALGNATVKYYFYTDGIDKQFEWYTNGVKTAENRYDTSGNATNKYYFYNDGIQKQYEWYTSGIKTAENRYDALGNATNKYYFYNDGTQKQYEWYTSGIKTAENRYDALGNATNKYYFYTDGTNKQFEWYTNGVKTAENRYDTSGNATNKYYFYNDGTQKQYEWYSNGQLSSLNKYDTNGVVVEKRYYYSGTTNLERIEKYSESVHISNDYYDVNGNYNYTEILITLNPITLQFNVQNAIDFGGCSIDFKYDPSKFTITDINLGSTLTNNNYTDMEITNDSGYLEYVVISQGGNHIDITAKTSLFEIVIIPKVLSDYRIDWADTIGNASDLSLDGFDARILLSNINAEAIVINDSYKIISLDSRNNQSAENIDLN